MKCLCSFCTGRKPWRLPCLWGENGELFKVAGLRSCKTQSFGNSLLSNVTILNATKLQIQIAKLVNCMLCILFKE